MNEESLFHAARALLPEERAAFLDAHCPDAALRQEIEQLLAAEQVAGHFLQSPPTGPEEAGTLPPRAGAARIVESPGTRIGPYKLLQLIGEGGMGSVWMAEQLEPIRRIVALKVIKSGLDSAQVVARFEAERQALALMDHPNIARVLDGGMFDGRPYFVMELVKGTPITKYCDEHRLTIPQRLELFVSVCHALQHAHQKGIIHRDIKPSNVLVAPYDDRPVVKVIDFGVAKATGPKLTAKTLFTEFGAVVGTLQYMSPEQAGTNNLDIDTRSDIYSLGVLLYEMLTGTTPLDASRLRGDAMVAMLMAIQDEEPPRPSTRISDSKDSLPSIAAQRHVEPARLSKLVRGDLDWITMKALEKDRARRYETANGLAMDVQRYLAGEPVFAAPPSAAYRLRKFVRRNRPQVIAASLVLLALVAGIVGTSIGFVRADTQRQDAENARANEADQRRIAEANERRANANFTQAREAVERMLTRVGDQTLNDVPGLEQLRRKLLEDALEFNRRFLEEQRSDASVRYDAAWAYLSVAEISKHLDRLGPANDACRQATQLFEELLASAPLDRHYRAGVAQCLRLQAELSENAESKAATEPALRRAIAITQQLIADFPDRIQYKRDLLMTYVYLHSRVKHIPAEADSVQKKALTLMGELAESDPDRAGLFAAMSPYFQVTEFGSTNLQNQVEVFGRLIDSLQEGRSKLHRSQVDDLLVSTLAMRAKALARLNRVAESEQSMVQAIELAEKLVADFPTIPRFRKSLGSALDYRADLMGMRNQFPAAVETYRKELAILEQISREMPDKWDWRVDVESTRIKLGLATLDMQYGNPASGLSLTLGKKKPEQLMPALDCFDRAIEALSKLVQENAQSPRARKWLCDAYQWRGFTWWAWENAWGARVDFDRALAIADQNIQAPIRLSRWACSNDDSERTQRIVHADRLARRTQHRAASAIIDAVAATELTPLESYNAACVASLCAGAVHQDSGLSAEARTEQSARYAARAMTLLNRAVVAGYKDAAHMKTDADLERLRERDDFQKLLEEMKRKE